VRSLWRRMSYWASWRISRGCAGGPAGKSRRERDVLRLLGSGASTRTIAKKLFISPATARNHVRHILAKLQVHSRLEAVTLALRNGLI